MQKNTGTANLQSKWTCVACSTVQPQSRLKNSTACALLPKRTGHRNNRLEMSGDIHNVFAAVTASVLRLLKRCCFLSAMSDSHKMSKSMSGSLGFRAAPAKGQTVYISGIDFLVKTDLFAWGIKKKEKKEKEMDQRQKWIRVTVWS